jgi:hypothetical protein
MKNVITMILNSSIVLFKKLACHTREGVGAALQILSRAASAACQHWLHSGKCDAAEKLLHNLRQKI